MNKLALNFIRFFLLSCFILSSFPVFAGSAVDLKDKYEEIDDDLLESDYGIPIYMESNSGESVMRGDVYGILYDSFKSVSANLSTLKNWCEIMPQHLNIKACTYEYTDNVCKLSFYSGRKFYEKADDVYRLNYDFKVTTLNNEYFNVALNSAKGPLGTKDYVIGVEAIPMDDNTTFIHFRYEYKNGFWTGVAMSTYLATIGRNKVGFTIEEMDEEHNPVYVKGIRGVIERNSMRYYFAIQSYLNTQSEVVTKRFEKRINSWFDLTEQHHAQLYEMDKTDYLKYKKMERLDQLRLQKELASVSNKPAVCSY